MEVANHHLPQEWKSIPTIAADSEKISAYFDCSICLDFARDPVVTLCGHLYCWPCMYKWLQFQSTSVSSDDRAQCPVCKAEISNATVVPLYGRGKALSEDEHNDKTTSPIPPRPNIPARHPQTAPSRDQQFPHQNSYENYHQRVSRPDTIYGEDPSSALSNLGTTTAAAGVGCHPMVGMFGEMVYARVFGNSESLYAYPNSYYLSSSNNARLRRQERIAHKSLNRVSLFLFYCLLICLIVF